MFQIVCSASQPNSAAVTCLMMIIIPTVSTTEDFRRRLVSAPHTLHHIAVASMDT